MVGNMALPIFIKEKDIETNIAYYLGKYAAHFLRYS